MGDDTGKFDYDVFLSYGHKDDEVIQNLYDSFIRDGLSVWFDKQNIKFGDDIRKKILEGLENSRVALLIYSVNSIDSQWAILERETVINSDLNNVRKMWIPLKLDGCEIPSDLKRYLFVDYSKKDKREEEYKKLIKELLVICRKAHRNDGQNDGQGEEKSKSSEKREKFQRNTERLFRKLKREIAEVLAGSTAAMTELETGMAQKGIDVVLSSSGNRHEQLAERLIDLDFEAGKDILLQAHENLSDIRESVGVRVIEKISRKLIPWLYVVHSSNTPMIEMKWGEVGTLGDILAIPAGISSFADIIMAGLDRREVAWESLQWQFPGGRYGKRLSNIFRQPGNGPSVSDHENLRRDLSKRIELPLETAKLPLDGQYQSIATQLEWMFKNKGIRIYYVCDDRPENKQDKEKYDKFLQWTREKFPALAIIELNYKKFLIRDQSLFNEIRDLLLTEG